MLSITDSAELLQGLSDKLEESCKGKLPGVTSDFFQLPKSHVMSFPVLKIFTAFCHSTHGLVFLEQAVAGMSKDWCTHVEELLSAMVPTSTTLSGERCM